jgi:hypothetical protein
MAQESDLKLDHRVFLIPGKINPRQWRCSAELPDNGIDGFINAARRAKPDFIAGTAVPTPRTGTPA